MAAPTLLAADMLATDNPLLDREEFAVIILDFGQDKRRPYDPWHANPALAVIGVPSSSSATAQEFLGTARAATARAARLSGNPRSGFAEVVPGVRVSVYSSALVCPDNQHKHLELAVTQFSRIPLFLASKDSSGSEAAWDPAAACGAVSANDDWGGQHG